MDDGWLIEPSAEIKARAVELQAQLARCDWLVPMPEHFLHVWLGGTSQIGEHASSWVAGGRFAIDYRVVNCFHSAVVVEAHALGLHELIEGSELEPQTFLPHLTIAVTREDHDAGELREILVPLHGTALGAATATEVKRVRFPAAQSTLLAPWEVVEVVPL
jgi:hypothetical protein